MVHDLGTFCRCEDDGRVGELVGPGTPTLVDAGKKARRLK
jgi:hypothetical protein